jgi:hypothetical protein
MLAVAGVLSIAAAGWAMQRRTNIYFFGEIVILSSEGIHVHRGGYLNVCMMGRDLHSFPDNP